MPNIEKSTFLFVVCQVGAEAVLKKEISREHPDFKFAYSRPGFVTFKCDKELAPDFELHSVFGRAYGLSLIKLGSKDGTTQEKAKKVYELIKEKGSPCLHVWERDRHVPGEEPLGFVAGDWRTTALRAIEAETKKKSHPAQFQINQKSEPGEIVVDLIVVEENEWWLGIHQHGVNHSPYPGGNPSVLLHPDAPSRAYIKLEEGLIWSGAPIRSGDIAVEVGSAPGGASFALLKRGVSVAGIDPAKMDRRVLKSPQFRHIQKPVAAVLREDLPDSAQWLLLDMNVTPAVSLYAVDRLATRMLKDSLLGLLLTVKLNQWKIADEIPSMLKHVKSMGMVRVKATQLPGNRQEIFICALTRKGSTRR